MTKPDIIVQSERYGELILSENQIIRFAKGIIGLQGVEQYGLVALEETPFFILHALKEQISFVLIPAERAIQDYAFTIDQETVELLGVHTYNEVVTFLIVNIIDNELYVNLKAPVLIAPQQRTGCQFVIHQGDYPIRFPLSGKEAG